MPFAYYERLSPARQRVYRRSDEITRIAIPDVAALEPLARAIEPALASGSPSQAQAACDRGGAQRPLQAVGQFAGVAAAGTGAQDQPGTAGPEAAARIGQCSKFQNRRVGKSAANVSR